MRTIRNGINACKQLNVATILTFNTVEMWQLVVTIMKKRSIMENSMFLHINKLKFVNLQRIHKKNLPVINNNGIPILTMEVKSHIVNIFQEKHKHIKFLKHTWHQVRTLGLIKYVEGMWSGET